MNFLLNEITEKTDDVSIVIPTYNRCLFQENTKNPLMWCISSIKQQSTKDLEIIVVNDNSTDYTHTKLEQLPDTNIKYIRNPDRKGSSISRNIGAKMASSKLLLFLDDDCIFINKKAVAHAVYSFRETQREGHQVGAMHHSVYYRSNTFKNVLPVKKILNIDYENSRIHCSTSSFPEERARLQEDDYFESKYILKPLEINNLAGVFLCERKAFLDVGGFTEYFPTPSLGEEHELAQRFTKDNYKIFLNPEPGSAVTHFKWGRVDKEPVAPIVPLPREHVELPLSLEEMIEESRIIRGDTGNVVTVKEALYSYVYGRMIIFGGDDSSRQKFIDRVKEQIIDNNEYKYFHEKLDDRVLRENICLNAITAAENERSFSSGNSEKG